MTTFIDPRIGPDPSVRKVPARFASDASELRELHSLCREARIYDVERWIQNGKPLQLASALPATGRRMETALKISLDRQDYSLTLLLLANGYDQASEPECPLDRAVGQRRRDLVELLLAWGGDPLQVCVETLCESYDSKLFERFRRLGVDFASDHLLAFQLASHTSNKPLFGFAKRYRLTDGKFQLELDIALGHYAAEGNEKGVSLCLWAGADPHQAVPDLHDLTMWDPSDEEESEWQTAVYRACRSGSASILECLDPSAELDDYDLLYDAAATRGVVETLARSAIPKDPSQILFYHLSNVSWCLRGHQPIDTVQALFEVGLRWESSTSQEIAKVRREFLRLEKWDFLKLIQLLATEGYCSQEVLTELARTPSIRKRMKEAGLIPATWSDRSEFDRRSPTKGRAVLARFGIELQKPKKQKPKVPYARTGRIGKKGAGQDLRLSRSELFEKVWSRPADALANEWGLSGPGLAKACRRLKIPVPPRGYWARVAAGQKVRRPKLPRVPEGQAEVILICLAESNDGAN